MPKKRSNGANRRRALEILATGAKILDVAKKLGVHRNTVARWEREAGLEERLANEAEALEDARVDAVARGRERLVATVDAAVELLAKLVTSEPPMREWAPGERVRLMAATAVLDRVGLHAKQAVEHDTGDLNSIIALVDSVCGGESTISPAKDPT
jgi:transcriptional regulator with XRE-family HTH domain